MPKLEDIPDLDQDAIELLEAVGYIDAAELATADTKELLDEVAKANKALSILGETPDGKTLKNWQSLAKATVHSHVPDLEKLEEAEEEAPDEPEDDHDDGIDEEEEDEYVNFEHDPEVIEMLDVSPEAIPLHPSLIRRHKLAVADIPEGVLLTQCQGEVEMHVKTTKELTPEQRREADARRTGLSISRIRSFDELNEKDHSVKPLDRGQSRETVSVSRDVNKGISPESRRFVRGVLHPSPGSVRTSAFFAALVQIVLLANLVCLPWMLFREDMFWWVVGLVSGLLLSGLCYLFWGLSARCRVCGQRQFAPKKCLKNKKAHHIPLIGYIFPTALHAMFYKWFYCTYCGTAVRLKK